MSIRLSFAVSPKSDDPVLVTTSGNTVMMHGTMWGQTIESWRVDFLPCPGHIQALRKALDELEKLLPDEPDKMPG